MKKTIYFLLTAMLISTAGWAQSDTYKNAIGARTAIGDGITGELSIRRTTFSTDRIQVDIGFTQRENNEIAHEIDTYNLVTSYQFTTTLNGPVYLFAGPAIGASMFDIDESTTARVDNEIFFTAGLIGGIDIDFDFPVILSLSVRPMYNFYGDQPDDSFQDDYSFLVNAGVSLRYQF